jgi:aldehyde dehydrogenase (NAD+)
MHVGPQETDRQRSVAKSMLQGGPLPRYQTLDLMPIAGTWREGRAGRRLTDVDPFTRTTLVEIALANAADVDEAYRGARDAQRAWATAPPQVRRDVLECAAQVLSRRRGEIIDWLVKEAGSTRVKADIELQLALFGMVEAASYPAHIEGKVIPASIAGKESRVYREPVGVVGVISPWNFPLHLSNRSVAPALALGNAVVIKPASDTPVTGGLLLARVYEEAGLPPGVLSVVIGAGSDIGNAFVEHPVPRVLSFTGSTAVGRSVGERAGRHIKKVCLELGGNSPFLVLADADLDRAVDAAVVGKFLHQGQLCMAINRFIVDAKVHDEFVERFAQRVSSLVYGDPAKAETVVGPLINQAQFDALDRKVKATLAEGARAVVRGQNEGLVYAPMLLTDVANGMPAAREELFGPVASVIRAGDEEEAIRLANETEYGLSASVFTRDAERGVMVARRIQAGMTHVNDMPFNDEPNTAFGGEKASGLGRFGGQWAIDEFSTDHWISVQHAPRTYPF